MIHSRIQITTKPLIAQFAKPHSHCLHLVIASWHPDSSTETLWEKPKAASLLGISDSLERGGETFYSSPENTVVARAFVYTERLWLDTGAEEWWLGIFWDFGLIYSCFNAYWLQGIAPFLHPKPYPSVGWKSHALENTISYFNWNKKLIL